MLRSTLFVSLCGLLFSAGPAIAATVTPLQGQLFINRDGKGFQPLTHPTEAKAGDAVMAALRARGQITFPDGCKLNVEPGIVTTIPAESPCKAGPQSSHVETDGSLKGGGDPPPPPDDRRGFWIGVGGMVVLSCVFSWCRDDPLSP